MATFFHRLLFHACSPTDQRNRKTQKKFRYEDTLRPIAKVLLDIETIETEDDTDTKAMKSILKLKMAVIDDNSKQIKELKESLKEVSSKEKAKYLKRLEEETAKFQKSLDFAMHQIELKDKRIDQLMEDNHILVQQLLACPCRQKGVINAVQEETQANG